MPQDSSQSDSANQQASGDPAKRLKEIRDRMAELRQRIKTERDPKAQAELRAAVDKLTELIAQLVRGGGENDGGVKKSDEVVWPRDLSAVESTGSLEWGADPAEVAGE